MISIREAVPEDAGTIHGFVCDLAEFERAADQVELTEQDYEAYLRDGGRYIYHSRPPHLHNYVIVLTSETK